MPINFIKYYFSYSVFSYNLFINLQTYYTSPPFNAFYFPLNFLLCHFIAICLQYTYQALVSYLLLHYIPVYFYFIYMQHYIDYSGNSSCMQRKSYIICIKYSRLCANWFLNDTLFWYLFIFLSVSLQFICYKTMNIWIYGVMQCN